MFSKSQLGSGECQCDRIRETGYQEEGGESFHEYKKEGHSYDFFRENVYKNWKNNAMTLFFITPYLTFNTD